MRPFPLADYAAKDEESLGRVHEESFKDDRPNFERDRDRIIHCSAFRRLEYKTQVFVNHEGDYYRTRLTHSIEVAQIARGLARRLRLHMDLAEALALAHDLGHTPFGHSGEYAVRELMADVGGFEHNHQSLRVVTLLEDRYPNFPGLNLCFETREGIIKHSTWYDHPMGESIGDYHPEWQPTLEAQLINYADAIAYLNHDIDDGLESGLLDWDDLRTVEVWDRALTAVRSRYGDVDRRYQKAMAISHLIGHFVLDLVANTTRILADRAIHSLRDVREAGGILVEHSEPVAQLVEEIRRYQYDHLYKHYQLERRRFNAQRVLRALFEAYVAEPTMLPPRYFDRIAEHGTKRVICDYIAGMTDRYALQEYARLYESPRSF
ncbi:MAG: deoxyguanosinetriphosphate triphosphohydrolase [Deltaproteobacteria bacterium]|nr:deoxyguanosinetriphosphate triphosphohydrolase [Deltaproteobacteria bacterium]